MKPTHVVVLGADLPSAFARSLTEFDEVSVDSVENIAAGLPVRCKALPSFVLLASHRYILTAGPVAIAVPRGDEPHAKAIAVGSLEANHLAELLLLGCSGALAQDASASELRRAVHAVAEGDLWFPRKVISQAVRTLLAMVSRKHLTQRERDVLCLIGAGLTNQEIADRLFVTRETVRWHVRSLYAKLGTRDRKRIMALHADESQPVGPGRAT